MRRLLILLSVSVTFQSALFAQSKIKDGSPGPLTPHSDAILELESTSKGFLLPRVKLSATNLAAPLAGHVEGMVVYNTIAAGGAGFEVSPGFYYNDGTAWIRLEMAPEPWMVQGSLVKASLNSQDIYQMGSVAIGKNTATVPLEVNGSVRGGNAPASVPGSNSVSSGDSSSATGPNTVAFGWHNRAEGTNAVTWGGHSTHPYGTDTLKFNIASGVASTAFGYGNRSTSWGTTTFGTGNIATNPQATAFGAANKSTGYWSTSFGQRNVAKGNNSTAFGTDNFALANSALAFGIGNTAAEDRSTAFGAYTKAKGKQSTAFGMNTIAPSISSTSFGRYNIDTTGSITAWITTESLLQVGNGTSGTAMSNALTILKSGKTAVGTHQNKPVLDLEVNGVEGMKIPAGTTAQRPSVSVFGTLRYNNTLGRPEMYVADLNGDGTLDDPGWLKI